MGTEPANVAATDTRASAAARGNPVDLHTHSNVSDGVLTPAALVQEAGRRGLRVLALTDHDTVGGVAEAKVQATYIGIELVSGLELSTSIAGNEVHILGYFVQDELPDLINELAALAGHRQTRAERIVTRLADIGLPLDLERVIALAGPGTIGRPHVARAMIERGYVQDVSEAFDRYLATDRPGYVPRHRFPPEAAVDLVRRAGGVPVLAHPLTSGDVTAVLRRLVPAGLRGIEVYYGEYEPHIRDQLRHVADAWGLIPTGGSDFHGKGFKPGRDLGGPAVPPESVERLREIAGQSQRRDGH